MIAEQVVLRLTDGMIALIVDQEQLDRKLVCQYRLQLLQIHHDTSIALNTDRVLTVICHTGTDSCRQTVAHAGDRTVNANTCILLDHIVMASHHAGTSV